MLVLLVLIIFIAALAAWHLLLTRHRQHLSAFLLRTHYELYEHPSLFVKRFAQSGQRRKADAQLRDAAHWRGWLFTITLPLVFLLLLTCSLKYLYLD